ncbi:MAG TPA: energy transducer TonB [Terriglobales bacterium]|jgi:TonB family protein|nr:energy transducer TonB [Terriglobales bacterium]
MQWLRFVIGLVICGTIAGISAPSVAPDADFRKELRHRYEGKLLLLSVPINFDVVHFDDSGSPTRPPAGEPWTTAGLIRVDKVDVQGGQVVIDGRREIVALLANTSSRKLVPITTDRTVHVSIDLPRESSDPAVRHEFLGHVVSIEQVRSKIENAWHADVDLTRGSGSGTAFPPDGKVGTLAGERAVYAWESGVVSKPKAIYKPGPRYAANALMKKVSGTIRVRVIVNEKGFPEIMEIVEHLREGLDANALSAVSQWRFEPGVRNGIAAASVVVVELKFNLAKRKS